MNKPNVNENLRRFFHIIKGETAVATASFSDDVLINADVVQVMDDDTLRVRVGDSWVWVTTRPLHVK